MNIMSVSSYPARLSVRLAHWTGGALVLGALVGGAISPVAHAATSGQYAGRLNLQVTGNVVPTSCDVDSSSQNLTVPMGDLSAGVFQSVGDVGPARPFRIRLKNCVAAASGTLNATVTFSGQADAINNDLLALSDTGGVGAGNMAAGVGLQILDGRNRQALALGAASTAYTLNAGDNILTYFLRYKATTVPVQAGNANAIMYYDMAYY